MAKGCGERRFGDVFDERGRRQLTEREKWIHCACAFKRESG